MAVNLTEALEWQPTPVDDAANLTLAIQRGLWPFRPSGQIDLYTDYDITYNDYRLLVEFPAIEMYVKLRLGSDELLNSSSDDFQLQVAQDLMYAIRYREALPVPNNINLGEN